MISAPHHSDHSFKVVKLVVSWIQCHHLPSLRLDCSGTIARTVQMLPLSPPWPSAIRARLDLGCLPCILPGEKVARPIPLGSVGVHMEADHSPCHPFTRSRSVPFSLSPSGLATPCASHFRLWLDCSAASLAQVRRSINHTMGCTYKMDTGSTEERPRAIRSSSLAGWLEIKMITCDPC